VLTHGLQCLYLGVDWLPVAGSKPMSPHLLFKKKSFGWACVVQCLQAWCYPIGCVLVRWMHSAKENFPLRNPLLVMAYSLACGMEGLGAQRWGLSLTVWTCMTSDVMRKSLVGSLLNGLVLQLDLQWFVHRLWTLL
jgi:hypothetical protein